MKDYLDLAQAFYTIGRLPAENMRMVAFQLLSNFIETRAVLELAKLRRPTVREAGPVFERVLADLGRQRMTVAEAAQVIARDLARRVVAGALSPREAARRGSSLSTRAGSADILDRFHRYADTYEHFPDQAQAIDVQVVRYAKELLADENAGAV